MTVHAFTSFTYSYLDRARVLARTLRAQHPDWVIWAVLTDCEPPDYQLDWTAEPFDRMITVVDLFGDDTEAWVFGHDIVEACTAVKGRALFRIMDEPGCEKVIYFDPDIAVFNPLTPVVDLLDDNEIVLTPHQVDPESSTARRAIIDNEIAALQYGSFNLGFIAVRNSDEGRRFATWWADRLQDWCHDRLDIGVFVDQKWCNLLPCFFDGVHVLRDPGYNVASWNLSKRVLRYDTDGNALVNGRLLRFYHFTKLGPIGDAMTRRYAADNIEVHELWWWYRQQVIASHDPGVPKGWWHYGRFDNGDPIPKLARETYRSRRDLRIMFPEPRRTGGGSFHAWLRQRGMQ